MSDNRGTLEVIALELAKLLQPLKDRLSAGNARQLFYELGIPITVGQESALSGPFVVTVNSVKQVLDNSKILIQAIETEDIGGIINSGKTLIQGIQNAIQSFDGIKTGIASLGTLPPAEVNHIPEKIFEYLLARYLERLTGVNQVLEFLGILDLSEMNAGSVNPALPPYTLTSFHFDKIGRWLSSPGDELKSLYKWGENSFDGKALFSKLEGIFSRLNFPVIYDEVAPPKLDMVVLEIVPKTDVIPKGIVIQLKNKIQTGTQSFSGDEWKLDWKLDFSPPVNTQLIIQPNGHVEFIPPPASASISGEADLKLKVKKVLPPLPYVILGQAGGSRFEVGEFNLNSNVKLTWNGAKAAGNFNVEGAIKNCKVVIDTTSGDGFLTKIIPSTKIESDFDLLLGVSSDRGFYIGGSSALEIKLPTHIELGPVTIEGLTIAVGLVDGNIPVTMGADIKAALGPLVAVVQNLGLSATFSFPAENSGNLGPLQMDIGFKPPDGVGLSIDTGVIKGGGFLRFDFAKGEYFGALELSFQGIIDLKAIGIINTKMPDGSNGFALLILITAEFTPIQLGFGFTLNGVGGLLGLNRSTDVEALKAGVKTGAVSSILFPQDVVANITRIISDLKSIFPVVQGHFIIAPMAKIGWGVPTLISLELGIIIDIPSPRLVILGVLRCVLPTEDAAILKLQVNFAGGIDFDQGLIWFDASLFDSSILTFTLSGDMALRIGWGDNPIFILSIGGFHPKYNEIPSDLRGMTRITLALLSGDNPRITAQIYFAVTSNSFQSGAKVELYAAACGFNIYGYLGYDLLVQFNPFYFIADIYAGLALRHGSSEIAGIDVHCQLSGPAPWHALGHASLRILFFKISIGFDVTWGEDAPAQPQELENVQTLIEAALKDDRNWKADLPPNTNTNVSLKKLELAEDRIIIHPFTVLSVSQKVVPLDLEINKFGNKKPDGATNFSLLYSEGVTDLVQEEFAIANFVTLSDAEKLSRKSFEKMKSGLTFKTDDNTAHAFKIHKEVNYELTYVHKKKLIIFKWGIFKFATQVFNVLVKGNAITKNTYSYTKKVATNAPAKVSTPASQYKVVNTSDLSLHSAAAVAISETEAYALHDQIIRKNPALKNKIQVVTQFELD